MNHPNPTKLALEEPKSWELYLDRREVDQGVSENGGRRLKENHGEHNDEHDHEHYRHHHRRHDKDEDGGVPEPDGDTMHGLMIDAGSQGTRIHIYEFERRLLHTRTDLTEALNGYKISFPTTNTRWTHRHKPGLDTLASYQDDEAMQAALIAYLGPVVEFSKSVLEGKKQDWYRYPIYLKATGGLRTLPTPDRIRLMEAVHTLFQNKTFNPFNFDDTERARVISGEEEAIYGWAAVNFAMGTLVKDSEGTGTALNPKQTFGMLEMGGVSTQIAFFENSGDVMANLIKLQIGGARHWNVYAHSFLYFGVNGAWARLNAQLYANGQGTTTNPCLPGNSWTTFRSWIHPAENSTQRFLPRNDLLSTDYSTTMQNVEPNVDECTRVTRGLLRKEANQEWVEFSHDGDCSFAGVYQPPLPKNNSANSGFILTSNYYEIWQFLRLPERANTQAIGNAAQLICEVNATALKAYNLE
jgi:Golgi nucleoside diphosphatase